jgi:hypothetical protein
VVVVLVYIQQLQVTQEKVVDPVDLMPVQLMVLQLTTPLLVLH